jgi:hypothetical protein
VLTGLIIGFAEMGAACSLLPISPSALLNLQEVPALVIAMTTAVVLIGPGAFSVDARLFGLREVTIPRNPPTSDL